MPRPPDVTEEKIAAWLTRAGDRKDRLLKMTPKLEANQRETVCAGFWLEEKLQEETQLPDKERRDVVHSTGQIAFGRDPWSVAETALFLVKNSATAIFKPGPKLAEDLSQGQLDGIFGPGPGVHSRAAIARLKEAMGIEKLEEVVGLAGASSIEEAKTKIEGEMHEMEKQFDK